MSATLITFDEALKKMKGGATVTRQAWHRTEKMAHDAEKVMKLVKKDEWDGLFPIGEDMIMINEGSGWGIWCSCFQQDVLAQDYYVI